MVSDDQIKRINELARKQKAEGLSKEEKEEQTELRNLYIQGVRNSLKNSLSTVKIIDPNGNDVTPQPIKALRNSGLH
ncbi:DUF896 domain-containing protein [Massilibacterium senegalense]|uniref:DUF896 domain-containing protein n=1 Tax=Massilibacterium senegalense TaxID=1632858 RepID=UPI000781F1ED|nr:DUF896 domain-containing protein [Massilibacterium senegalense]